MPWPAIVLAAYVVTVHSGVIQGRPEFGVLALLALISWLLLPSLRRRSATAWAGLLVAAVTAGVVWWYEYSLELLYLPPVTITLVLLILFSQSLRPGRTPLVTVFALQMGEQATPELLRYTRAVTIGWSILLAGLLAQNAALVLWASPAIWSLFANILNYLLLGVCFVIEFRLRRHFLPQQQRYPTFTAFARALIAHGGPLRKRKQP